MSFMSIPILLKKKIVTQILFLFFKILFLKVDLLFYFERSLKHSSTENVLCQVWLKLIKRFPIKNENQSLCQNWTSQLGQIVKGKLFKPQTKHHSNHARPFPSPILAVTKWPSSYN